MEENKQKSKKCLYCGNYTGYYTKGEQRFNSLKKGYCFEHQKIVACGDSCEYWRTSYRRNRIRKYATLKTLYDLLTNLSAVRQILQECQEEE